MGPLGWLDTGGYLRWPGSPLGGHHVPGLPLQEEGEAGGGSHQALGPRRQPGKQGSLSRNRQNIIQYKLFVNWNVNGEMLVVNVPSI